MTDLNSEPRMCSIRADSPPPQTLYRGWVCLSSPKTDTPAWLSVQAAVAPAGPMPTMRTSYDSDSGNAGMNTRGLLPEIPTYSVSLKKAGDHGQGVCIDHHPDHD